MRSALLAVLVAAGVTLTAQKPVPPPEPKPAGPAPDQLISNIPILTIANLIVPDKVLDDVLHGEEDDGWDSGWFRDHFSTRPPTPKPKEEVEEETQDQHSILDDIAGSEKLVISSNEPRGPSPARAGLWALIASPFAVVHAEQPAPDGVQFLFTSLGVSTGEAFDVRIVNHTGKPVTLPPGGLVLRPLKKQAAERVTREFNQHAAKAVRVRMSGYCLQFRKDPPKAGMVFAAAPEPMQQQFAAAPIIFRAAAAMHKKGLYKPTGNATAYFHSVRQWAWWTQEQRFTEETFTTALLEYTKKNLQNAKQPWSKDAEAYVRATAPNRWADIVNTLRLAQKLAVRKSRAAR